MPILWTTPPQVSCADAVSPTLTSLWFGGQSEAVPLAHSTTGGAVSTTATEESQWTEAVPSLTSTRSECEPTG